MGSRDGTIRRVALLAPFEGRYREIGYNAYYAVKLAMQDMGHHSVELLAVDDGGTAAHAADRARALAGDPLVEVVIAMGYPATQPETQVAFGQKPVLIVGEWGVRPESDHVFILSNPTLSDQVGIDTVTDVTRLNRPLVGSEVLALSQVPLLTSDTGRITVMSSASPPDAAFRARYLNSAEFAPEPGLLATLTYDAMGIALQAILGGDDALNTINRSDYEGINGRIRFEGGYWTDAPIQCYGYADDTLAPKNCAVE